MIGSPQLSKTHNWNTKRGSKTTAQTLSLLSYKDIKYFVITILIIKQRCRMHTMSTIQTPNLVNDCIILLIVAVFIGKYCTHVLVHSIAHSAIGDTICLLYVLLVVPLNTLQWIIEIWPKCKSNRVMFGLKQYESFNCWLFYENMS